MRSQFKNEMVFDSLQEDISSQKAKSKDDEMSFANKEKTKYQKLYNGLKKAQALANIGHWELDLINDALFWSDEVYRIFGLKPQEFGATYEAFLNHIHPSDRDRVNNAYIDSLRTKEGYHIEHRIIRQNGEIGFVEERCEHEFDDLGRAVKSIGTVHDITDKKKAQNELLLSSAVFKKMNDGVLITDEKQSIITINKAFSKISGYSLEEVRGKTPKIFSSGWHDKFFYEELWDDIEKKHQWRGEIKDRKKNGQLYSAEITIIALRDEKGTLTNYISIVNDVTKKKEQEELIHNLAYFDSLTNLPNRVLFHERVTNRIPVHKSNNKKMALLFIDMDNFKNINDTLGHFVGDRFLIETSKLIKSAVCEQDTLCRLGGDEFIIMIENIESLMEAALAAENIVKKFSDPVIVDKKELYSGVSIGISIYPDDASTYEELIKAADTAMYHVKESGKNSYQFYKQSMNEKVTNRMLIENDLRNAINKDELYLEYQPKVDLDSKTVYGMEALLRWEHSQVGLIKPDMFISIAEETGQIQDIGLWVVKQAVKDIKIFHDKGHDLSISINVSSKQLDNDSFVGDVCKIVDDIGVDKSYIEFEITETHIMKNVDKAMAILNELHAKGFKLSIDDFGTGYSSLSYLKRLPVKTIKIDRSFVLDIDKDEEDRSIVATIVAIAESLGKEVIAEGSETRSHINALKLLNCNKVQGYFFSKPLKKENFEEFANNFNMERFFA